MFPTMAKRKKAGKKVSNRVSISYRTSQAVRDAIDAFILVYGQEHPGVLLPDTQAVDVLVREALRNRGIPIADEKPSKHD